MKRQNQVRAKLLSRKLDEGLGLEKGPGKIEGARAVRCPTTRERRGCRGGRGVMLSIGPWVDGGTTGGQFEGS